MGNNISCSQMYKNQCSVSIATEIPTKKVVFIAWIWKLPTIKDVESWIELSWYIHTYIYIISFEQNTLLLNPIALDDYLLIQFQCIPGLFFGSVSFETNFRQISLISYLSLFPPGLCCLIFYSACFSPFLPYYSILSHYTVQQFQSLCPGETI